MRRYVVSLLAAVSAFSQAAPPVVPVKATSGSTALASAQTTSLTSTKTRTTYGIGHAGGITLKLEERGTFSRNSVGDEATHLKVIRDGQATAGTSLINKRKDSMSYVIDDARQQYRIVPWPDSPAGTSEVERQLGTVVTRTINGIKCVAVPARDSSGKTTGKDWISPDYGITVRSERDVLNQETGAAIGLIVEELSDIQVGATPDPSGFAITLGYKEVRK
jgi:hypothetical protein